MGSWFSGSWPRGKLIWWKWPHGKLISYESMTQTQSYNYSYVISAIKLQLRVSSESAFFCCCSTAFVLDEQFFQVSCGIVVKAGLSILKWCCFVYHSDRALAISKQARTSTSLHLPVWFQCLSQHLIAVLINFTTHSLGIIMSIPYNAVSMNYFRQKVWNKNTNTQAII